MYKLDRTRKCKIVLGILTLIFFALFIYGLLGGGEDSSEIIAISSLFCAVGCLAGVFVVSALEKDIAEWLSILEDRLNNKKS